MKKLFPLLALFLFLYSCKKDEKPNADQKKDTTKEKNIQKDTASNLLPEQHTNSIQFGKKPSDLVPDGYEIQYDAEGDLNQDGLSDMALVIRKKEDTLADRKMIIY